MEGISKEYLEYLLYNFTKKWPLDPAHKACPPWHAEITAESTGRRWLNDDDRASQNWNDELYIFINQRAKPASQPRSRTRTTKLQL